MHVGRPARSLKSHKEVKRFQVAETSAYLEFWLFKLRCRKQEDAKLFGLDINSQACSNVSGKEE